MIEKYEPVSAAESAVQLIVEVGIGNNALPGLCLRLA